MFCKIICQRFLVGFIEAPQDVDTSMFSMFLKYFVQF